MSDVLAGYYLNRVAVGLACIVAAVLGLGVGGLVSASILERNLDRDGSYVVRIALPSATAASAQHANADRNRPTALEAGLNDERWLVSGDSEGLPESSDPALAPYPAQRAVAEYDEDISELSNGQTLLNVEFDLADHERQAGDFEVGKAIHLNGRAMGVVSVSVDRRSQLHISSQDLSQFLTEELFAQVDTGADYIAFDDLRAGGLDISYDPLDDVLRIDT